MLKTCHETFESTQFVYKSFKAFFVNDANAN